MVGDRVLCDGDVFGTGCGAGCFSQISGFAFPEDVCLALHYLANVGLKFFVVSDRNPFSEIVVIAYSGEVVVPSELGVLPHAYQIVENLLLKPVRFKRPLFGL
jgi:hypothetical protein